MSDYTVQHDGIDIGPKANTSRTLRLYDELSAIATAVATKADPSSVTASLATKADIASPSFTGKVTVETGLLFGSDTADANTLDDYEEGTWTPDLNFGGAHVGLVYNVQAGSYTKIGDRVLVTMWILLTSKGTSTGSAVIGGLPFTVATGSAYYGGPSIRFKNISFSAQVQALAPFGNTVFNLEQVAASGTQAALTDTEFTNTSNIMLTYAYKAA